MIKTDVLIVGGGHAGCEAAWAAAKQGCSVVVCTLSADTIAYMPCNPAIGGTAKGQLVREIDALGGLMGEAIDATGLQFKVLNRSRGPAVWAPRAQADKKAYSAWVRGRLEAAAPGIQIVEAQVVALRIDDCRVVGAELLDGTSVEARSVVVTTGTFLNGVVHVGDVSRPAGRASEPPSIHLGEQLRSLGFRVGRLKTGTPPRLSKASIDFEAATQDGVFHVEHGDQDPTPLSFLTTSVTNSIPCWVLHSSLASHAAVRSNVARSPLYNGTIKGIGPRYCPSFEDKVMRFPDRDRHLLHLEPEGVDVDEIYVNGLSMSLPAEVQAEVVASLPGLGSARMVRPGYAVEYDFVQPTELRHTLETRRLPGLFLAGQINGTSGYEEAAGQGLLAGLNAARRAKGEESVELARDRAYLGVMVDDLVTHGCLEPYRLFTSRAEYRLLLRADNADLRLTELGRGWGLVDAERWSAFEERRDRLQRNTAKLRSTTVSMPGKGQVPALDALKVQTVTLETIAAAGVSLETSGRLDVDHTTLETEVKYAGYLRRQDAAVRRLAHLEHQRIPEDFSYRNLPGFSTEVLQRLEQVRPETVGQARRIPGITPAALLLLSATVAPSSSSQAG